MFRRKNVQYVSEVDKMLDEFNATQEKSAAQVAEIKKYERIHALRDGVITDDTSETDQS